MKIFHHYHHRRLHSDLSNFELSVWLQTIGYSIISIFIPIFMLVAGYSVQMVMAYCAIFYLVDTPLNFLARKLMQRFGARLIVVFATLSIILYFALFSYLSTGSFLILIALAILAAIYDSFYWVAYFYLFMESIGNKREVGKSIGILAGILSFGGILGPLIGAGILIFTTQSTLLFVSIVFFALSIIPLIGLRYINDKPNSEFISVKEFFKELPEKKNFLSWFLYSIHLAANGVIWPIFIFTLFGTLKSIALVAVIVSVSKIPLSYLSGITRSRNREKLILTGVVSIMCVWILRLVYPDPVFYYFSILFIGVFTVLVEVPLDSNIFERARIKKQSLVASTFRNAAIMFPQGLLFAALALLVGVFNISFISAIVSLVLLLFVGQMLLFFSKSD